ncbi:MAG TPA: hypothetical protein VNA19_04045 [Pyrinomonadaceae bacterium]|jgi:hypothetical protein|nr:hypothetical protein [Pyrinomonadaceae bacterium]
MPFHAGNALLTSALLLALAPALDPNLPPLALAFDVAIDPVARYTGVNALFLFLPILVLETLVLWALRWGNFVRAATGAFVMNAVTTLAGAALQLNIPDGFVLALLLSIFIEGFILMLFARERKLRSWVSAFAANILSYVVLFVSLVVLFRF